MTPEQAARAEANLDLVGNVCRRWPRHLRDELSGELGEQLCVAAIAYDQERCTAPFRTYAAGFLWRRAIDFARGWTGYNRRTHTAPEVMSFIAQIHSGTVESVEAHSVNTVCAHAVYDACTAPRRDMLDLFAAGMTQAEVSRSLGCTEGNVSRKLKAIRGEFASLAAA